ncbi:transposase [Microvirga sp. HBU67558]|nr:transposase [Microvirga sp. HBU67558]
MKAWIAARPPCLESLDDWVDENNPVRVIDSFVDSLDLRALGFDGVVPEATGHLSYYPAILLKLYIYGYLNRVRSSRRLERKASRNVALMWLTGRLAPDHKTIAKSRRDSGRTIRQVCTQFVTLSRGLGLLNTASVSIDGAEHSRHPAVDGRPQDLGPGCARVLKLRTHRTPAS